MKTWCIVAIAILVASGVLLVFSFVMFEMAEQYFENERNGLVCNKPGSSCPYPDFGSPVMYGAAGLGVLSVGAVLAVFRDESGLAKRVLGSVSVFTGVLGFASGILAYLDDYRHLLLIIKRCSSPPCMSPNVFANVQFAEFYAVYGAILVAAGVIFLVRGRKKK